MELKEMRLLKKEQSDGLEEVKEFRTIKIQLRKI